MQKSNSQCNRDRKLRLQERLRLRFPIVSKQLKLCGEPFDYLAVVHEHCGVGVARNDQRQSASKRSTSDPDAACHQPYWSELWESSIGVCEYLANGRIAGLRVLDLGCGLGIVGAFAASRGAKVLLADAVPEALLFARYHCWAWRDQAQFELLDWQHDTLDGAFDLIIGADILYDQSDWILLSRFWQMHLAPDGKVILAEPGRSTGRTFRDWIVTQPWQLHETRVSLPDSTASVRIFQLSADTAVPVE